MPPSRNADSPQPPESASDPNREQPSAPPASPLFLASESPSPSDDPSPDHLRSPSPDDPAGGSLDFGSQAPSTSSKSLSSAARRRVFRRMAADVVAIAGAGVNGLLSRHPVERDAGVWLPDDDDVKDISEPVANIANRRVSTGGGADSPDAADLFSLGLALVGYVVKSVRTRAQLRSEYAHLFAEQTGPGEPEQTEPADVEPATLPGDDVDDLTPGRSMLAGRAGVAAG